MTDAEGAKSPRGAPRADAVVAVSHLRAAPARAEMGPVVSRLGRNAVVVPVSGLDSLAAAVCDATAALAWLVGFLLTSHERRGHSFFIAPLAVQLAERWAPFNGKPGLRWPKLAGCQAETPRQSWQE